MHMSISDEEIGKAISRWSFVGELVFRAGLLGLFLGICNVAFSYTGMGGGNGGGNGGGSEIRTLGMIGIALGGICLLFAALASLAIRSLVQGKPEAE